MVSTTSSMPKAPAARRVQASTSTSVQGTGVSAAAFGQSTSADADATYVGSSAWSPPV
jgi:hypothetical protein